MQRRDRTPRETEITFLLVYKETRKGEKASEAPTVSTENTVAVIKEKEMWRVRDVVGAQTTFDFPLSAASLIKARPGGTLDSGSPQEKPQESP